MNRSPGAYNINGHLYFILCDGSAAACDCNKGPVVDQIVDACRGTAPQERRPGTSLEARDAGACSHNAALLKWGLCDDCERHENENLDLYQPAPTPQQVNASWFAALKGCVVSGNVFEARNDKQKMISGVRVNTFAPENAVVGEKLWVAMSKSALDVQGIGRTPAEAIAAFNKAMVEP